MALSQTVKKPRRDRRFCANLCEAFRLWCGRQDSNLHAEAEEPKGDVTLGKGNKSTVVSHLSKRKT